MPGPPLLPVCILLPNTRKPGRPTGLDNQTPEKYIELPEKAFIVFRPGSLSRNRRNELTKTRKIYFYENGRRNAVIHQFSPAGLRQDTGAPWETL